MSADVKMIRVRVPAGIGPRCADYIIPGREFDAEVLTGDDEGAFLIRGQGTHNESIYCLLPPRGCAHLHGMVWEVLDDAADAPVKDAVAALDTAARRVITAQAELKEARAALLALVDQELGE